MAEPWYLTEDKAPIFRCEWCGQLIYVPHSEHFRMGSKHECKAYAKYYLESVRVELRREGK
jgi:hypothetical protein